MKVADIMQREVEYVSTDASVREVTDLIFGRSINGVPVIKDKKIVGLITEKDILAALYPSMQDIIEDPVHSQNFSEIEERANEVLKLPARKIMSKVVSTIRENDHIMKAEAIMLARKIGRLPVLDEKDNLVGVISKGDIFRAAIGAKMPHGKEEGFYDWLAHHYDVLVNWNKRLKAEIPELDKLFKKNKVKKVIDMGSSTGEHSIALAKIGYNVTGLETSSFMGRSAEEKRSKLPEGIKDNSRFLYGKYKDIIKELDGGADAVIFMGNAISHILHTNKDILREIVKTFSPKQGLVILQIANFNKIFKGQDGFDGFSISPIPKGVYKKHAFLGFYTKISAKEATFTQAIFDTDGNKWSFSGMRSTSVAVLDEKEIRKILKNLGFITVKIYGSSRNEKMFAKSFNEDESDMMTIVAKR